MKIPLACYDRFSSSSAGEIVGQFLGSLCVQYVAMDRSHPAVETGLRELCVSPGEQRQEQAQCTYESSVDAGVEGYNPFSDVLSKSLLSRESASLFVHSASDRLDDAPEEAWHKEASHLPASTGALSSCSELSEIELRFAEVNPVTYEAVPPSTQHGQRAGMVAGVRLSREHQAPSRLADDFDAASDGGSSHSPVCLSDCHSGGPASPTTMSVSLDRSFHPSEEASRSRVKLMCSFGVRVMSTPVDGKLRYVGGETRILAVNRVIRYNEFMSKMADFYGAPLTLKYQLPDEDLDALISISSDDDLQNMMEEYEKLESNGGVSRIRLFFFTSLVEHDAPQPGPKKEAEDRYSRPEQRYVDALNRNQEKIPDNRREDNETGFRQADSQDFSGSRKLREDLSTGVNWSVSPVRTFSRVPSTPSSPPISPSMAHRQEHLKPLQMGDSSFQISKERLDSASIQNGSGSSSSVSLVDCQYRKPSESPRRLQNEVSASRGESWRTAQAGMRRGNSQTRLMRQLEQQMDCGTVAEVTDVQQPSDMLVPTVERQRLVYKQHKRQQQQLAWQPPQEGNLGRGETMQRCPSDVHRQPHASHQHREAVQQRHQATHPFVQQSAANYDERAWDSEFKGVPSFLQGSAQSRPQTLVGLPTAPSHQMVSAPSSPRITHDCKGWCNCVQQHAQVHRGINVCLNDQLYSRKPPHVGDLPNRNHGLPPHLGDQPTRKHGFPDSLGLCDNVSHCSDRIKWPQHTSHFTGPKPETCNALRHVHDRHTAQCHVAECKKLNRGLQHCDSPVFTETTFTSHDQREINKTRCLCSGCYDSRREPVVPPVYTDMQDEVGGWVKHQRSLELDEGTSFGPRHGQIPLYKGGDRRGGLEVEERSGGERDLYCNRAQGDFKPKPPLPIPVGVPYHGNFTMRMLPTSRQLTSEDMQISEASITSVHSDVKQHSKLGTLKLSAIVASSGEPRVWSDTPPSVTSHVPHIVPEDDFIKNSISEAMPTTHWTSTWNGLEKSSGCKAMFKGKHDQGQICIATESFVRDDTSRRNAASRVVGEAATELVLPVPSLTHDGFANHCDSPQTSPMNGHAHLLSNNCIPVLSLAPLKVASALAQQAVPQGAPSITPLEELTSPMSRAYDHSPLSTTDFAGFSLEPNIKGALIKSGAPPDKKELISSMSVTGLLADGMISPIPNSCSNGEQCSESRLVDHEAANANLEEVKNNETEQDTETVTEGLNSNLPSTNKGDDCSLKGAEAVNGWLNVSVQKELLPGMVPVLHNGGTKESVHEEKDVAAGNVCVEENESALRLSDAEATGQGLQVIKNADLEDLRELGSGTFGTVFHGKWRGSDVAIKRIKASCFMGRPSEQERLITDFWKEAHTLSQLHHPNIVAFYGVVPDGPEGTLATVTEYMVNGSLKQVLRKKDRTIDRRKRLIIAMGAAFGMEYLHSKNIVHFDLKCDNLLVNMKDAQRPICKVGDFGLSKVKHRTMVSGGVRGTLPWMAPELLRINSSEVTEKIDVFSFGIVMWELLTGEEPYANMNHGAIIGGIVNNTLRPSIPSWCEPGWRALMERCWSGDPAERPPFSQVATELRALAVSINVR